MQPALAGKKIIYADKMPLWGGDSAASCYFMFATGTKLQKEAGLDTTIEQKWETIKDKKNAATSFDWWPEWIKEETFCGTEWVDCVIDNFGAQFQRPSTEEELPALYKSVILPKGGIGSGTEYILTPLHDKLVDLGAEFIQEYRATALIKDANGTVIGCRFQNLKNGKNADIKAKAVVLATGCFIDNQEMMIEYEPQYAPYGNLVNNSTGDGQLMGMAAGAQMYDMNEHYANLMGDIPNATTWGYWVPIVLVLPNGKRFIKEDQSHDAAQAAVDAGYREWWVIFDQVAWDAIATGESVAKNVKHHEDVYRKADTIEDLAAQIDVPVENLVETFTRYNELVASGKDDDFGKLAHLDSLQPPFHALREHVCRYKSIGGMIVNDKNLVLDTKDQPISGLYACGACTTMSESGVSECATTGYHVGKSLVEALA